MTALLVEPIGAGFANAADPELFPLRRHALPSLSQRATQVRTWDDIPSLVSWCAGIGRTISCLVPDPLVRQWARRAEREVL